MKRKRTSNFDNQYTKKDLMELRKLFKELAEFGKLESVQEYRKTVEARLRGQ